MGNQASGAGRALPSDGLSLSCIEMGDLALVMCRDVSGDYGKRGKVGGLGFLFGVLVRAGYHLLPVASDCPDNAFRQGDFGRPICRLAEPGEVSGVVPVIYGE